MLRECGVRSFQERQHLGLAVSGDAVSVIEGYFGTLSYVYSSQHSSKYIAGLGYLCCRYSSNGSAIDCPNWYSSTVSRLQK